MTPQEIKEAVSSISKLLGSNPEMLRQQLAMLKAFVPNLDDSAINRIVEKTEDSGFSPHRLEAELQQVIAAIKSAAQD